MSLELEFPDIQGNILHGYGLDSASHCMIHFNTHEAARRLLTRIMAQVTPASMRKPATALNVGVTYTGFEMLGVRRELLERFPKAFGERPRARAVALGDLGASAPENWQSRLGTGDVHVILTAHTDADDQPGMTAEFRKLESLAGVEFVDILETKALSNAAEHFGFADGASQPAVEGALTARDEAALGGGIPMRGSWWRPVKAGEFILGYPDEDDAVDQRPEPALVRNGSYVVWRKLRQDVAAFRARLHEAAEEAGLPLELMAAKVVGRWRDGVPIELAPWRDPRADLSGRAVASPPNNFRYLPHDRDGEVCPRGAHIRRTNPRDAIEFGNAVRQTGELTARHRIIRRGMPYGPELPPEATDDDGTDRGLLFVCYQADLERQFELIQRAWCSDGDAFYLGEEQDFMLGNASGKMTIPRRGESPRFVTTAPDLVITRGMEYLFAPGLTALRRLARGDFGPGS